jgi:hypothetical protein
MTKSIRLTDIQLVLLATAAQRDNGSLLPPPDTVGDAPARIRKAVESLIRRGLAAEVGLPSGAEAWRTEDEHPIGVVITDAGRAAIAVESEATAPSATEAPPAAAPIESGAAEPSAPATGTKTALVLDLLRRTSGATLDELTGATHWLPHTTRAALTGLRKRGYAIDKRKRGEVTCYHLGRQA